MQEDDGTYKQELQTLPLGAGAFRDTKQRENMYKQFRAEFGSIDGLLQSNDKRRKNSAADDGFDLVNVLAESIDSVIECIVWTAEVRTLGVN